MRILLIGLDERLMNNQDDVFRRQLGYFEGHELVILVLSTKVKGERQFGNVKVIGSGGLNKILSFINAFYKLFQLSESFELVTTQDVLFTGLLGWWFSWRRQLPFFVQLHGDYLDNPRWIKQRALNHLLNWLGKRILQSATGIRVVSDRLKQEIIRLFSIPAEKILSLPICTDLSIYTPQGEKVSDGLYLLFVGRLIEEKDPLLFTRVALRLMQAYPDLQIVVAGEGNLHSQMEKKFEQARVTSRVQFLGNISSRELAFWYRSSLCLMHTAPWEGWGMPMIEAMACGCPVITTDTGCAGEAVRHHEQGLVYPVGDENGLVQGGIYYLTHPTERAQAAEQAIEEAQRWSFEARKGDLVKFYATRIAS